MFVVQEERQGFAPDRFGGCGGKDKVTYHLEIRIYTYKHHLHTYIYFYSKTIPLI